MVLEGIELSRNSVGVCCVTVYYNALKNMTDRAIDLNYLAESDTTGRPV